VLLACFFLAEKEQEAGFLLLALDPERPLLPPGPPKKATAKRAARLNCESLKTVYLNLVGWVE